MKKFGLIVSVFIFVSQLLAQTTEAVQLKYISPDELITSLGVVSQPPRGNLLYLSQTEEVSIRLNQSNNQVMISGNSESVAAVKKLIDFMDVPARQIVIEVKILEIDETKSHELGIDWQTFLDAGKLNSSTSIAFSKTKTESESSYNTKSENRSSQINAGLSSLSIGEIIKIVQENGAGTITTAPRIVTTNNKTGKLIDGSRISYVTRYSTYTNLFETQELTTGLAIEVTPSIGESGYLQLAVKAKMTTLGTLVSGSPSETGQILENTVIVQNKDEFLLGEFKQTEDSIVKRKVPLLGSVLPFLFSRDENIKTTKHMLIILTPEIIDLNPSSVPKM